MYVDTSKNEDTWCGMLGEYISHIQYNLESIQKVVALIIFHTYRNSDDNLYVRYLYFNEGHWKQDNNWLDNDFDGNNSACVSATLVISLPTLLFGRVLFC